MCYKCCICVNELQSYLKFNIPGITPTWNGSTWSSSWGQLIWMTFLDWPGYLWHEISRWPSSIQRQFWWHGCLIIFPMRTRFQDFPHPCLFVPYMCFVLAFYLSHILQKGYPPPPRVDRPCVLFRIVPAWSLKNKEVFRNGLGSSPCPVPDGPHLEP